MTTKAKMFLGKLLIVFSIFLILGGIVLQFENSKILHPEDDVVIIAGIGHENISITTVDDEDVIEPIIGNNSMTVPEVIPPIDSNTSTGTNNDSGSNLDSVTNGNPNNESSINTNDDSNNFDNTSDNNDNAADDTLVEVPSNPVESIPTIEEVNVKLRNEIESTYGIKIKYGNETNGYSVGGMSTTIISDETISQAALNNLNSSLALYPTGFFKEIANAGYPVTFYLIKRYSTNNVTGVTDSTLNNIVISIATDYDFSNTFHHEVYHYIENYIYSKGSRFTSWSSLNPSNFTYGTVTYDYSYTKTFSEDAFFVNVYAQTDEYEDRASTFEYMMKSSKASCLNSGKTVWLKARTMSEQIDYFLNTVSPNVTEYWERHIY